MKKILLFILIFVLQSFPLLSEEEKFNYDQHKQKLIKKKLLLNSFKKFEEYINKTSVELFLNCSDENSNKKVMKLFYKVISIETLFWCVLIIATLC